MIELSQRTGTNPKKDLLFEILFKEILCIEPAHRRLNYEILKHEEKFEQKPADAEEGNEELRSPLGSSRVVLS